MLKKAQHSLFTIKGQASAFRLTDNPFLERMDSEEQWLRLDAVVGNVGTVKGWIPMLSLRRVCP